ncbi:hypothetical protein EV147_3958 [Cupriavidus agavae]|uniref:Uncharacterized protein n=2 Tax=Cupriavidus agavae TaxID=1001822 RepID=A0A4Q7RPC0_9BURK|nr:hypothetical protein EV147_3958 [Cupriavidus agavae]
MWWKAFGYLPSKDSNAWDHFGSFVGGTVSPLLSFAAFAGLVCTIIHERALSEKKDRETEDMRHLELAAKSLEKAFNALANGDRPVHDRLAWLNCARLILASNAAADLVSADSPSIRNMYLSERSYWRSQFYDLLRPTSGEAVGMQPRFFERDSSEHESPIDERSIRVIYEFIRWPEGEADVLDSISPYTNEEVNSLPATMLGIKIALQRRPHYRRASARAISVPFN